MTASLAPSLAITGRRIAAALMDARFNRTFVLNNYTPAGWWECDVFEVSRAGYFREYEVKVSRADFLADRTKRRLMRPEPGAAFDHVLKHHQLGCGRTFGPVQFWYVTPPALVTPDELPAFAGLIELERHPGARWIHERVVRPAPKLHRQKLDPKVAAHAERTCYYRMHDHRRRLAKLREAAGSDPDTRT